MAIYEYRAKCVRVIDGDTVDLDVDLGFHMRALTRFRLLGVNTPELRGGDADTKLAAQAAKKRAQELLFAVPEDNSFPVDLLIHTEKADSFGRWLASVMIFTDTLPLIPDGPTLPAWISISDILIYEGLGLPYRK